jgi:5'-3' exonuclease
MGVKDFLKITNGEETFESCGQMIEINDIKNTYILVDGFNELYKAMHHAENMSYNGKFTGHLKIIYNKCLFFEKHGCKATWLFDKGFNPLKQKTQQRRREKSKIKLTRENIAEVKKIITLFGFDIIETHIEAEFYAVALENKLNKFYGIFSTDTDILALGGTLIQRRGEKLFMISGRAIMNKFGLSSLDMAKIAVLMGCDFAEKKKGMGPKKILAGFGAAELSEEQRAAYDYYLQKVDLGKSALIKSDINKEKLINWLHEDYGFARN